MNNLAGYDLTGMWIVLGGAAIIIAILFWRVGPGTPDDGVD